MIAHRVVFLFLFQIDHLLLTQTSPLHKICKIMNRKQWAKMLKLSEVCA